VTDYANNDVSDLNYCMSSRFVS